ncbi:MAG: hypothetical protein QGH74_06835 [Candidatus Brocadiia bacterium]|nr:hypothetical protein [Candidatus Brocadiia bacterium]
MPKEVMRRRASDNVYLHKDFHGALSRGVEYVHEHFGEEAAQRYLRQFTAAFYAPLIEAVKEHGLKALKEHFEKIYELEGGKVNTRLSDDELVIEVEACPAVMHMREHGYHVARLWRETTGTVNEALCEGTPFAAEMPEYDEETGRSVVRFYRRRP